MARIAIPVLCLEFEEGGSTIWVQSAGGTVLRVKVKGKLSATYCKSNPASHLDLMASDVDPVFCLGPDAGEECSDDFSEEAHEDSVGT